VQHLFSVSSVLSPCPSSPLELARGIISSANLRNWVPKLIKVGKSLFVLRTIHPYLSTCYHLFYKLMLAKEVEFNVIFLAG